MYTGELFYISREERKYTQSTLQKTYWYIEVEQP